MQRGSGPLDRTLAAQPRPPRWACAVGVPHSQHLHRFACICPLCARAWRAQQLACCGWGGVGALSHNSCPVRSGHTAQLPCARIGSASRMQLLRQPYLHAVLCKAHPLDQCAPSKQRAQWQSASHRTIPHLMASCRVRVSCVEAFAKPSALVWQGRAQDVGSGSCRTWFARENIARTYSCAR